MPDSRTIDTARFKLDHPVSADVHGCPLPQVSPVNVQGAPILCAATCMFVFSQLGQRKLATTTNRGCRILLNQIMRRVPGIQLCPEKRCLTVGRPCSPLASCVDGATPGELNVPQISTRIATAIPSSKV